MRTAIYGSRPDGHAKVIAEFAAVEAELELVGLIDDFPENRHRVVDGLRVVGTGHDLATLVGTRIDAVLLGFGDSRGRAEIVQRALDLGLELPTVVHPSAVVSKTARLGRGVQVLALAYVGPGATLGDGVLVNTGAVIEHDVALDAGAVVFPNATLTGRVSVARSVTVGAGATVLPDVEIGQGAFVGAGAVVTRDVPAGARVAGVPAHPLA